MTTPHTIDPLTPRRSGPPVPTEAEREFISEIVAQLAALVETRGLSQAQAAATCGMDRSGFSKLLRSETNLTLATLRRVADGLDADVTVTVKARRGAARR